MSNIPFLKLFNKLIISLYIFVIKFITQRLTINVDSYKLFYTPKSRKQNIVICRRNSWTPRCNSFYNSLDFQIITWIIDQLVWLSYTPCHASMDLYRFVTVINYELSMLSWQAGVQNKFLLKVPNYFLIFNENFLFCKALSYNRSSFNLGISLFGFHYSL